MADKITDTSAPDLKIDPARNYPLVVKADSDLPGGPCRGLLVDQAGLLNLTDLDGNEEDDVFVVQGYNPLACSQVRLGGDDIVIRALY